MDLRLLFLLVACLVTATCLASPSSPGAREDGELAVDLEVNKPIGAPAEVGEFEANKEASGELSARKKFRLPKLFDFDRFKAMFKRTYSSFMEEMARQRLYLARAFRVFVSAIQYKREKQSYYLGVNEMSDRTPEEIDRTHLHFGDHLGLTRERLNVELADEETIMSELKAAVNNPAEPLYADIADELEHMKAETVGRRKRDTNKRNLPIDELVLPSSTEQELSPKLIRTAPSNNPDYEPPDLVSYGDSNHHDSLVDKLSDIVTNDLNSRASSLNYVDLIGRQKVNNHLADQVYVDHRDSQCMLAPRTQGDCGSCYIFPVITLYEFLYCRETGNLLAFSEGYPLDCGIRFGLQNCSGGFSDDVFEFTRHYGLALRREYAYKEKASQCPYDESVPEKRMGYMRADRIKYREVKKGLFDEVLKLMPIVVYLAVQDRFHEYGGGVDDGKGCQKERAHAVLLVGSGREDGVEYWLMRNSYGVKYGEAGYYKIDKAANCTAFGNNNVGYAATGTFFKDHHKNVNKQHVSEPYKKKQLLAFEESLRNIRNNYF